MRPQFDDRDAKILDLRFRALEAAEGPRVGDWIQFDNGALRVTYRWPDGVQTTLPGHPGSFYLGTGGVSYSGGLAPSIPFERLELTDEKRDGAVWFFHHDFMQAHNGVNATMPFRVYRCKGDMP